jgi:steroid delta-isomerase-like uncharacterized protein
LVEHQLPKLRVAGSNPVSRSGLFAIIHAGVQYFNYVQAMIKRILGLALLVGLISHSACSSKSERSVVVDNNANNMKVTEAILKDVLDAFNRHDLDAIMDYFTDDCTFDFPRGPEYYGQRFVGKAQVREALAGRFKGIPDVHYGEDRHWISADGNMGVSEWTLTGTTTSGRRLKVNGCDLWEFRDGKVTRKNSYWKIVELTAQ